MFATHNEWDAYLHKMHSLLLLLPLKSRKTEDLWLQRLGAMLYKTCTNFELPFLEEKQLLSTKNYDFVKFLVLQWEWLTKRRCLKEKQQAGSMRLLWLCCLGNNIRIYNDISWCLVKATYIPKVCINAVCFCWSADKITWYRELAYVLGKISVYVPYLYFVYCSNRVIPGLYRAGKLPGHCHAKNNAVGNGGKYFSENNSFNHSIRKHS